MNCKDVQKRMVDMLDGELSEQDEENIANHFSECNDCDEEFETLEKGKAAVQSFIDNLDDEKGSYLTAGRLSAIQDRIEPPEKVIPLYRFVSVGAAAAAVIVAIMYLPSLLGPTMQKSPSYPTSENQKVSKREAVNNGDRSISQWRVSLASDKSHAARTVNGYMDRPGEGTRSGRGTGDGETGIYANHSQGLYVPVDKDLYNAERDGYWW